MMTVRVSTTGIDHELRTTEVEAASLFEAAGLALKGWALLWWYDPKADVLVQMPTGFRYRVSPKNLREKLKMSASSGG